MVSLTVLKSPAETTESDAMASQWARDPLAPNVVTLVGYGLSLTVSRGHLILKDGVGRQRRERRLPRVQRQVTRIVILGQTGHISLEAIRWCVDTNIALIQIDTKGRVGMLATTDGRDDPRLRRAQALAAGTSVGFQAARELILAKISGQANVVARHNLSADVLDRYTELADGAATLTDLAGVEAQAALRYFTTWANEITVRFARDHTDRVPQHWAWFVARSSLIHPSPGARDAADPINAMLNYGYALAETECTLALRAIGLDPGLGVMHTDKPARDSLALDLIEPLRPVVDDLILQLIARRVFTSDDFVEDGRGGCRLTPALASELAGLMPEIARVAAVYAEHLLATFTASARGKVAAKTPLTRANWHAAKGAAVPAVNEAHLNAMNACEICGILLDPGQRKHCRPCWEQRRRELAADRTVARSQKLAELRAQGKDPRGTKQAVTRRSATLKKMNAEHRAWHPTPEEDALDNDWYDTTIAPRLQEISVRAIQVGLGVSDGGASKIRRGVYRPHKRHWLKLRELIDTAQQSSHLSDAN